MTRQIRECCDFGPMFVQCPAGDAISLKAKTLYTYPGSTCSSGHLKHLTLDKYSFLNYTTFLG